MSLLGPLPKGSACKALSYKDVHLWELPTGEEEPSAMTTLVHSHGGPGAFHAVQTVVFRHTGHQRSLVLLVFIAEGDGTNS